jgi:hypothetical protein
MKIEGVGFLGCSISMILLRKSTSYIYVKHKDGKETRLDPAEYAVYKPKPGDSLRFQRFQSNVE